MRQEFRSGLDYLDAVTALLQRVRRAHPTHGSYQAAELQWWWSVPRSTDDFDQLFWFDDLGQPEAAFVVTDFGDGSSALYDEPAVVVVHMPDADPSWVARVVGRGLAHLGEHGISAVEMEVDRADDVMLDVLSGQGFTRGGDGMNECWLEAGSRPQISPLPGGYRVLSRSDTIERPHHMARPGRLDVERRLRQTSLYRSDLDLLILDESDEVAAYGLFWYDPVTATGVVEPMRTLEDHRRRGLARHLLTTGVDLLAEAGVERISIAYRSDNPAAGDLYRSVGFEPHRRTDVWSRSTETALP